MMYSPPTGGAAWTLSAAINKKNTSKRRFIISGEEDYLCALQNCASGRDVALRCPDAPAGRPYQFGSTSPRVTSFHVSRFRISANLSPRTRTSAGRGREL